MSSHKTQLDRDQSQDAVDALIRWALMDEVAGEKPSPQVWQNIQGGVMARPRPMPGQSRAKQPWRHFASTLQSWGLGLIAPLDVKWDSRLGPRERAYLIWRETLSLPMMFMPAMMIY